MAFTGLKKKIAKNNEFLAQRFTNAKGTDTGDEYKQLSLLIDAYKSYFEDVRKRSMECLEPGANIRIRPTTTSDGSHNNPGKNIYPHAELLLGQCFEKYGKVLDTSTPLGSALISSAEGYRQLAEAKNRCVEETQTRFVQPISETLKQDIKEIVSLRKKAEDRRLTYDVERNRLKKCKITETHPDYVAAQTKFQESMEDSSMAMANFLESDAEHVEMLFNFVNAQLSYVEDAKRVLSDLQSCLQVKLEDARNSIGKRVTKLGKSAGYQDFPTPTDVDIQFKSKHDGPTSFDMAHKVPTCQVLFDFVAENPFELTCHQGDMLRLIEQVDENWFLCELSGKEGHVPTTYVQVLVPPP